MGGVVCEEWTEEKRAMLACLIHALYGVVRELEKEFGAEKRKFTLDGHLVGSIGEVVASYAFGLKLYQASTEGHDAEWMGKEGKSRKVQIKLTGGTKSVGLRSEPEHLIVLQLVKEKNKFEIIYNGPGAPVWDRHVKGKNKPSSGQYQVSLKQLKAFEKTDEIPLMEWGLPDLTETLEFCALCGKPGDGFPPVRE